MPNTSDNDSYVSDEQESGSGGSEPDAELDNELFMPISVPISTAAVSKEDLIKVRSLFFPCRLYTDFSWCNVTHLLGPEVCSQFPPSYFQRVQGSEGEKQDTRICQLIW